MVSMTNSDAILFLIQTPLKATDSMDFFENALNININENLFRENEKQKQFCVKTLRSPSLLVAVLTKN